MKCEVTVSGLSRSRARYATGDTKQRRASYRGRVKSGNTALLSHEPFTLLDTAEQVEFGAVWRERAGAVWTAYGGTPALPLHHLASPLHRAACPFLPLESRRFLRHIMQSVWSDRIVQFRYPIRLDTGGVALTSIPMPQTSGRQVRRSSCMSVKCDLTLYQSE